jgi:hypothetical protein
MKMTTKRAIAVAVTVLRGISVAVLADHRWDKRIPNAGARFQVLSDFGGDAVLDKETGLVWERVPSTDALSWAFVDNECLANLTGQRLGWRGPRIEELLSLMDPLNNFTGKLPTGHPFELGESRSFWSSTTDNVQPANNDFAFVANFEPGGSFLPDPKISALHRVWCVRGGGGYDGNN